MAMIKKRQRQQELWIATNDLPRSRGHIFYDWVNEILNAGGFDAFVEEEVHSLLQERADGATEHCARCIFSEAADRILRRDRLGARHRVKMCGFLEPERFSGIRADGGDTRSLDGLANATADRS
jgi:hypothetical protein